MKTDKWLTPRHILDALGTFDFDPCSAPDPVAWPTAGHHVTLPDDGLTTEWFGRVWLNPPYGKAVWSWLGRLAAHGDGIALVFARTEVRGFVDTVWGLADGVLFLGRRLQFCNADTLKGVGNGGGAELFGGLRARECQRPAPVRLGRSSGHRLGEDEVKFIERDDKVPIVELSRRNLKVLLAKLDDPLSARTLIDPDFRIAVRAVEDSEHYANRAPGLMFMPSRGVVL
jgi:hypothetical protein